MYLEFYAMTTPFPNTHQSCLCSLPAQLWVEATPNRCASTISFIPSWKFYIAGFLDRSYRTTSNFSLRNQQFFHVLHHRFIVFVLSCSLYTENSNLIICVNGNSHQHDKPHKLLGSGFCCSSAYFACFSIFFLMIRNLEAINATTCWK